MKEQNRSVKQIKAGRNVSVQMSMRTFLFTSEPLVGICQNGWREAVTLDGWPPYFDEWNALEANHKNEGKGS